jgi:hypothetical protein
MLMFLLRTVKGMLSVVSVQMVVRGALIPATTFALRQVQYPLASAVPYRACTSYLAVAIQ